MPQDAEFGDGNWHERERRSECTKCSKVAGSGPIARANHERNSRYVGRRILKELQRFSNKGKLRIGKTGNITSRPRQARHYTLRERIRHANKDYGNALGFFPQWKQNNRWKSQDDLGFECNDVFGTRSTPA